MQFWHSSLSLLLMLVHIVLPKKINPVFIFRRAIFNVIFDEVLQICIWFYDPVYHQYIIVQSHFYIQKHYLRCKTLLLKKLGANLLSWKKWCLREIEVLTVNKEAGICFVLPEACVLHFYREGQTMMCTRS